MAATGYTPISLYYSTTASAAPTAGNLVNGELAINITDGKLYYKDNLGAVKVIAGTGGAGIAGGSNTQVQYNSSGSLAGSANMTFDGTTLTVNGLATTGTVTVGDASGDALTINSSAVSIPNGLNFDSNTFVIDATNNRVGVGTSSPSYPLDVYGASSDVARIYYPASGVQTSKLWFGTISNTAQAYVAATTLSGSTGTLEFGTGATERMRIDASGNVGIGTSSPSGNLHVNSSGTSTVTRIQNTNTGTGAYAGVTFVNDAGTASYIITGSSTSTSSAIGGLSFGTGGSVERMRLDSSGNLGLGVTPSAWETSSYKAIDINSGVGGIYGGASRFGLTNNAYLNTSGVWTYKATGTATRYQSYSGEHQFYTAASGTAGNAITFTQAMTLNASGQLSVGSTSAGTNAIVDITSTSNSDTVFPLQVYANNRAASLSISYGAISASSNLVLYSSGTSNYAILNTSGNLGLGVSPAAWESGAKVIQMSSAGAGGTSGNYGSIWARSDTIRLINAAYFDSGSYRYAVTGVAPNMLSMSNDGAFYFTKAASGTAGNSFSFTNQMVIDASGYLLLTSATPRIQIVPSTSTNNALIQFQNTGGNVYVGTDSSAGGLTAPYALNLYHSGAYPIVFTTNSSERMRIDSSGNVGIGNASPTTKLDVSGTSALAAIRTPNILEISTVSATAATGTINFDVATQSVVYYTSNASGNFTLNFRGSSGTSLNTIMNTGDTVTVTFMCTNGSTAYYNSAVTIDGSSVTPKWQGGTAPTSGNVSSVDAYTYAIIKTGSAAFTVLATQTKFA